MRTLAILLLAPLGGLGQGIISTVAGSGNGRGFTGGSTGNGGPAIDATLNPNGVAVDAAGNIYIADLGSGSIRKVNTAGIINVFAGDGHGLKNDVPATSVALIFRRITMAWPSIKRGTFTSPTTATSALSRWIPQEFSPR